MGITFVGDYAPLPPTAPSNHPHIIDVTAYARNHEDKATKLKLQDAVVTMLHNISIGSSDALNQSLDADRPSFRLVQKYKDLRNTDKFVIAKKDNKVLVRILAQLNLSILVNAYFHLYFRSE
jgi:hypothetical protein